MTTWHQDNALRRAIELGEVFTLRHSELYTVVENPHDGMMSVSRWSDAGEAERHLRAVRAGNPKAVSYVLPPAPRATHPPVPRVA
jgi:hypothetical protein